MYSCVYLDVIFLHVNLRVDWRIEFGNLEIQAEHLQNRHVSIFAILDENEKGGNSSV